MRMEASSSSAGGPSPSLSTMNTPLSNPLIHPAVPAFECSPPSHRFDYYTDPTAAYSAVKRKTSNSGGGGHSGGFQPSNFSSPISAARPIAGQMEHQTFPNYTPHVRQFPSPNPSLYETPLPRSQSDSWRSPVQYPSPTAGNTGSHNFSRPWNMSRNSSGHSYYSNSSGGPSSSRRGESPMSSAYSGLRGSPHSHSSGRGWQYRGGSPSPGWSGGRGRGGYHNKSYGLGRQQLDSFYVKSMVKDPWRKLKPVIGNILVPLPVPQSWLPKSIAAKKVKVAEVVNDIKPKQNLAEFLALAFEETISNEQEGEGSIMPNPNDHF